jgi:shikimate kinase
MPHIYLTGMMGSGKSVTAKKLAALLNLRYVDLDTVIEAKSASTISEIFAVKGEPYFRNLETAVLKECSEQKESCVFATGGGVVLRAENISLMKTTGAIVYLETSPEVLWERVKGNDKRPLLKVENPRQTLEEIFNGRREFYEKTCQWKVLTDGQTAEAVAQTILSLVEKKI